MIDKRYKVEGDLRREVAMNIKRLIELAATGAEGTGAVCRSGARGPRPMHVQGKVPGKLSECTARNHEYRRLITAWQLEQPRKGLPGKEESEKILSVVRRISVRRSIIL